MSQEVCVVADFAFFLIYLVDPRTLVESLKLLTPLWSGDEANACSEAADVTPVVSRCFLRNKLFIFI